MKKVAIAIAAAVALPGAANAATIVNGSFEQGVNPGSFTTIGSGDNTSITGWTVGGNGVDYIGSLWQAADGVRSIDLSALDQGTISQDLTGLVEGQRYVVSFAIAGNPDGDPSVKLLLTQAAAGGLVQADTFTVTPSTSRSNMNWQTRNYGFTAAGGTARLTFSSGTPGPFGPALDNVSIAAVPEPATWAMMIMGFGAVGGMLRRRSSAVRVRFAV